MLATHVLLAPPSMNGGMTDAATGWKVCSDFCGERREAQPVDAGHDEGLKFGVRSDLACHAWPVKAAMFGGQGLARRQALNTVFKGLLKRHFKAVNCALLSDM